MLGAGVLAHLLPERVGVERHREAGDDDGADRERVAGDMDVRRFWVGRMRVRVVGGLGFGFGRGRRFGVRVAFGSLFALCSGVDEKTSNSSTESGQIKGVEQAERARDGDGMG